MFKIVRFPDKLDSFFRSLKNEFHWDHYQYFRTLVLAMAFAWGRRNIVNLDRHLDAPTHRTRLNNFLHAARINEAALLRQMAYEQLEALGLKPGTTVYLILDDSKKDKRGKLMDAVGKLHGNGKALQGHLYMTAVIRAGDVTIPFAIQLYAKKEHCPGLKVRFRKTTEIAAEMIRAFAPGGGLKVVVLFDSYFLCPKVVGPCREQGYRFVATLKDNRTLYRNGRKLRCGTYKKNLWRRQCKGSVRVPGGRKAAIVRYVDAGWMGVNRLGQLRVIFTKKNADRRILGIVTDDPDMTPKAIVRHYSHRWWIEVFFKDAKQLLGLGQYQNRPYRAAVIHLHLVCFAYALLTHLRLEMARGAQAKHAKANALRTSTALAQNDLRHLVWRDAVKRIEEKATRGDSFIKELEKLLIVA